MSDDIRKNLLITEINDELHVNSFFCRNQNINEFFHKSALDNDKRLISKVYVYVNIINNEIAGFMSLSAYRLNLNVPEKYSITKVPAVLLGRLAIDDKYRGYNLGKDLITYVCGVCNKIKKLIGCRLLITEIKRDDPVIDYFKNFGFEIERINKKFYYLSIDLLI